jgi:hypothetical protein
MQYLMIQRFNIRSEVKEEPDDDFPLGSRNPFI